MGSTSADSLQSGRHEGLPVPDQLLDRSLARCGCRLASHAV